MYVEAIVISTYILSKCMNISQVQNIFTTLNTTANVSTTQHSVAIVQPLLK